MAGRWYTPGDTTAPATWTTMDWPAPVASVADGGGDPRADALAATVVGAARADGNDCSTGGAGVRNNHHPAVATSSTAPAVVAKRAAVMPAKTEPTRSRTDGRGKGRTRSTKGLLLGRAEDGDRRKCEQTTARSRRQRPSRHPIRLDLERDTAVRAPMALPPDAPEEIRTDVAHEKADHPEPA